MLGPPLMQNHVPHIRMLNLHLLVLILRIKLDSYYDWLRMGIVEHIYMK